MAFEAGEAINCVFVPHCTVQDDGRSSDAFPANDSP